jgi:hypothetical protein
MPRKAAASVTPVFGLQVEVIDDRQIYNLPVLDKIFHAGAESLMCCSVWHYSFPWAAVTLP